VIANYARDPVAFASGLTIFADTSEGSWVDHYADGPWASTRWDELFAAAAEK
jgi:hypothetical protein